MRCDRSKPRSSKCEVRARAQPHWHSSRASAEALLQELGACGASSARVLAAVAGVVAAALVILISLGDKAKANADAAEPDDEASATSEPLRKTNASRRRGARRAVVARPGVAPPSGPHRRADLHETQPRRAQLQFKVSDLGGTTPKFDCDARHRRRDPHQVRQRPGGPGGSRGDPSARARLASAPTTSRWCQRCAATAARRSRFRR